MLRRVPIGLQVLLLSACCSMRAAEVQPVRPYFGEPPAPTQFVNPDLLVSTERLSVLLGDGTTPPGASLVIIDARSRDQYTHEHITGAYHIDSDAFQESDELPYCLARREAVAETAKRMGIGPETKVVIYDAHGARLAARVWFTFWAYGHNQVCILEGGFNRWKDEQRIACDALPPAPSQPGTWVPAERLRSICSLEQVKSNIAASVPGQFPPTLILDARSNAEYTGQDVRGRAGGHVPGAANLPWDTVLNPVPLRMVTADRKGYFTWREPAEIYAVLRAAGLTPRQPVIVYDQSGGRSAHLLFTLYLMGFTQAVNYNAGWREYGSREDSAIER